MNIRFQYLNNRPAWQRYLIFALSIMFMIALFWIGMVFFIGFAILAFVVALINTIKVKLTGRPLFSGPKHFHRYQSQFRQTNVIEGELVEPHKDDENK
ncbi:hypothetical protein [Reinekea marinisedimentorum]|uniref:Uncharacterized protein n=1 Tax=Reinekea marinisedimentorum TaxID=230495 RepID=A0A4V2UK32_9GAMM|nr:hypothetical protein [Reinekea marinisedimentorum]TCS42466.1 hypothetical protein BCF53_103127 [Reinekea marinisedimentorum]